MLHSRCHRSRTACACPLRKADTAHAMLRDQMAPTVQRETPPPSLPPEGRRGPHPPIRERGNLPHPPKGGEVNAFMHFNSSHCISFLNHPLHCIAFRFKSFHFPCSSFIAICLLLLFSTIAFIHFHFMYLLELLLLLFADVHLQRHQHGVAVLQTHLPRVLIHLGAAFSYWWLRCRVVVCLAEYFFLTLELIQLFL